MNRKLSGAGAIIVTAATIIFAISMLLAFDFGSFFSCMFLSMGYLMMTAGFLYEAKDDKKVSGIIGMAFAVVYAVLINAVYFAQLTSVRLDNLNDTALKVLDYGKSGLMFNYDLLGYGFMALSTFFIGLTIEVNNRKDKWLRLLLIIHGLFFISCIVLPIAGVFGNPGPESYRCGVIALEFWCIYFIPVGILSYRHFK